MQSYSGWPTIREGGAVKTEEDPLHPNPPKWMRESMAAFRHIDRRCRRRRASRASCCATALCTGRIPERCRARLLELFRKRQFPIVGGGGRRVVIRPRRRRRVGHGRCARQRGAPGIYNVVDDDPARRPWEADPDPGRGARRKASAAYTGVARPDRRGRGPGDDDDHRSAAPRTQKAKRAFGWQPRYPSWREGVAAEGRRARPSGSARVSSPHSAVVRGEGIRSVATVVGPEGDPVAMKAYSS